MNISRSLGQVILALIFLIYLIGGYKTPNAIVDIIDSDTGRLIITIVAFGFFLSVHPILGILGLLVAYELIRRSVGYETSAVMYIPSEAKKTGQLTAFNQFPYTLEQEMVTKMVPQQPSSIITTPPSFVPSVENTHDASMVSSCN